RPRRRGDRVKLREVISLFLGVTAAWSLAAHAQESGTLGTTNATTATLPQVEVTRVKPVDRTPPNLRLSDDRIDLIRRRRGSLWRLGVAPRRAHREYRALARLARHCHVAAHHARELAGDGKAEPRAAIAARCQGIGLREILEQFRLLFGGQANAGIGDRKLDPVASIRHLAHAQRDLALFRELTGIAQQI